MFPLRRSCCARATTLFYNPLFYNPLLLTLKLQQALALRPAPLQVAWLGFPGGVGGDLVDYIVGDPAVSPPEHAEFFLERLALLPRKVSYQVNNYKTDPFIGSLAPGSPEKDDSLEAMDVPDASVVYTSLNHARKVKPMRFDSFARVLAAIPDSKLSLLARHSSTGDNLRREAEARGVSKDRIHIAKVDMLALMIRIDLLLQD